MLNKLFALRGAAPAYEIYSPQHYALAAVSVLFIAVALFASRRMDRKEVERVIKRCVLIMSLSELVKIMFNLTVNKQAHYLPLYYCSIHLYVGWLSAYGKGRLKRMGDVFLLVGGLVGGISYFVSPITTAGKYPVFHFITIQSFAYHSIMIYLSVLFIMTDYIRLKMGDVWYYITPVILISIAAYLVNMRLGTNYMFISRNRPGTPIEIVYNASPRLFPLMITFWQTLPPFFVVQMIAFICRRIKEHKKSLTA